MPVCTQVCKMLTTVGLDDGYMNFPCTILSIFLYVSKNNKDEINYDKKFTSQMKMTIR